MIRVNKALAQNSEGSRRAASPTATGRRREHQTGDSHPQPSHWTGPCLTSSHGTGRSRHPYLFGPTIIETLRHRPTQELAKGHFAPPGG